MFYYDNLVRPDLNFDNIGGINTIKLLTKKIKKVIERKVINVFICLRKK